MSAILYINRNYNIFHISEARELAVASQGLSVTDDVSRTKLARENTFTKDSSEHSVSQSSAAVTSSKATSVYQSQEGVKLVKGKLVKASTAEDESYVYSDLRASFRKPQKNESHIELVDATAALEQNREARAAIKTRSRSTASSTRQEKTASLVESSEVSKSVSSQAIAASGKQRAVRRKTWTKEDNENLTLEDLEVAQYVGNRW